MSHLEKIGVSIVLFILLCMSLNLVNRVIILESKLKQKTFTCDEIKAIAYKDDFFFSCLVVNND